MKKSLITFFALSIAFTSTSAVNTGFYRIKNFMSERYAYMLDDKAYIDTGGTKVDVTAIELWKDLNRTISDPSTIIYITKDGSNYDISAQGTSIYKMIGEYLKLREDSDNPDAYLAYGTYHNLTKTLADGSPNTFEDHSYLWDSGYKNYRLWNFIEIDNNTDNYFGIVPTESGKNGQFTTLYMGFDIEFENPNTTAYVITMVDNTLGYAVYEKIEGKVAAKTPIVILTDGSDSKDNKAIPSVPEAKNPKTNFLGGAMFQNTRTLHENFVKYDAEKMRVLGVLSDGSVGFYNDKDREYVDRNKAYLKVEPQCPAEVRLVSQEEYDYILSGQSLIMNDAKAFTIVGRTIQIANMDSKIEVYNIMGSKLHTGNASQIELPSAGIYIIVVDNSKYKVIVN